MSGNLRAYITIQIKVLYRRAWLVMQYYNHSDWNHKINDDPDIAKRLNMYMSEEMLVYSSRTRNAQLQPFLVDNLTLDSINNLSIDQLAQDDKEKVDRTVDKSGRDRCRTGSQGLLAVAVNYRD